MDQNIEYSDGESVKTKPTVPKVKKFIQKRLDKFSEDNKLKTEKKERMKKFQNEINNENRRNELNNFCDTQERRAPDWGGKPSYIAETLEFNTATIKDIDEEPMQTKKQPAITDSTTSQIKKKPLDIVKKSMDSIAKKTFLHNQKKVDSLADQFGVDDLNENEKKKFDDKNAPMDLEDEGIDYADMDAEQLDLLLAKKSQKNNKSKVQDNNKVQDKTRKNFKVKEFNKKNADEPPADMLVATEKNAMLEEKKKFKVREQNLKDVNEPPADMIVATDKNAMLEEKIVEEKVVEKKETAVVKKEKPVHKDQPLVNPKITFKSRIFGSCSNAKGTASNLFGLLQSKEESEAILKNNKKLFSKEKFEDLPISDKLKRRLKDLNYDLMTTIQARSFDPINRKRNCVMKSETGSGKTLAYLVPILNQLLNFEQKIDRKDGTYVLIICPTRELCIQVVNVYQKLMQYLPWIVCGMLVGGESISHEKARIRKGLNVVIGTPGRILYHMQNTENFKRLDKLQYQIFEECDRTQDLGFKKEVDDILEILQGHLNIHDLCRQLVAASFNHKMENLCQETQFLESEIPNLEQLGRSKEASMQDLIENIEIPASQKQNFIVIAERQKISFLITLLCEQAQTKGIIFVATADMANFLEKLQNNLTFMFESRKVDINGQRVIPAEQKIFKLHGHIKQEERAKIFNDFNATTNAWLISTDVGCRGLDFKDTKIVIIFDVPQDMTDYVNRIGRTARISAAGSSILFLNYSEELFAEKIIDTYHIYKYNPVPVFDMFFDRIKDKEAQWQNTHEYVDGIVRKFVQNREDKENYYLARRAYNSFCRAYARMRDRECFNLKNLNLLSITKSYGMSKVKSKGTDTLEDGYDTANNTLSKYKGRFQPKTKIKTAKMLTNLEFM